MGNQSVRIRTIGIRKNKKKIVSEKKERNKGMSCVCRQLEAARRAIKKEREATACFSLSFSFSPYLD